MVTLLPLMSAMRVVWLRSSEHTCAWTDKVNAMRVLVSGAVCGWNSMCSNTRCLGATQQIQQSHTKAATHTNAKSPSQKALSTQPLSVPMLMAMNAWPPVGAPMVSATHSPSRRPWVDLTCEWNADESKHDTE
jgi:hypothetical protein